MTFFCEQIISRYPIYLNDRLKAAPTYFTILCFMLVESTAMELGAFQVYHVMLKET